MIQNPMMTAEANYFNLFNSVPMLAQVKGARILVIIKRNAWNSLSKITS